MRLTYASWVAAIARHARAVLAASLVLAILAGLSLTRVQLDIDVLSMLPSGTPAFDDFRNFTGAFGQLDELLVLIDAAPPAELRRFVDALVPRLAQCDTVAEVHARIETAEVLEGILGTHLFNYIPEDAYAAVAARLSPEAIDAQVAANRAILAAPFDLSAARQVAADPLGLRRLAADHLAEAYTGLAPVLDAGYFAAQDGSALLVFVRPTRTGFGVDFSTRLLADVDRAVADARQASGTPGVRVRLTGGYVFALEDATAFKQDIRRYVVLALGGVLAIFYLAYGNLRILPYVTYPLVLTTLTTFALSLALYDQLNALSLSFAAILYGLAIDSAIHFYSRLTVERARGDTLRDAVTATLAGLGRANVAATATTAAAFAVIGLSALLPVRQLGVLTAIGMGITMVGFFTLYPALAMVMGTGSRLHVRARETVRLARIAEAAARRATAMRAAVAIAAVVLVVAATRVPFDATLDKLRPADSPASQVQDEIAARFVRTTTGGAVIVGAPELEEALQRHEQVAALLRRYRERGLLRSVEAIDVVLPSAHTQRARLARFNALPRDAAREALQASLQRHGFRAEPFAPFLRDFAAPRDDVVRAGDPALAPVSLLIEHHLRSRGDGVLTAAYVDIADGTSWPTLAAQIRADLPGVPVAIAARPLLEDELGRLLGRELLLFLGLAFAGTLALLVATLRDVRTALAVVTPDALVIAALFAGMWALGLAVDPVNLVIPPLIFGIGVDNGIYLATAVRQRGTVGAAVRTSGRAIAVTSLTTIAGFGFLAFSTYPPLATLGRLMAIGLALSVAGTFVLLPALLPGADGRSSGGGSAL